LCCVLTQSRYYTMRISVCQARICADIRAKYGLRRADTVPSGTIWPLPSTNRSPTRGVGPEKRHPSGGGWRRRGPGTEPDRHGPHEPCLLAVAPVAPSRVAPDIERGERALEWARGEVSRFSRSDFPSALNGNQLHCRGHFLSSDSARLVSTPPPPAEKRYCVGVGGRRP